MITYVNTNAGDTLGYPNILRVTFGESPSFFVPNALAAAQLSSDIDNLVSSVDGGGYPVAIASDPSVAPDGLATTIDFAPLDPYSQSSIAAILNQLQAGLMGSLEFISNSTISRVEKVNANAATGSTGAVARGTATAGVETAQQSQSFGAQLTSFLSSTEHLLLAGAVIAGLFYFGPEIKVALKGIQRKR